MKFHEDGEPLSDDGYAEALSYLDVDAPTFWALLTVESGTFGFLPSRRPVILFERQVFHRLTEGRFDVDHPDISNVVPGGYLGGAAEYSRLNAAAALDADAAMQSASWGLGQVMGFHYDELGYKSVQQMADMMKHGEDDQVYALTRFLDDEGLIELLQAHNWRRFARRYNGPSFARTGYDVKLATAYARYQQETPNLDVRFAQAALWYLGFKPGPIDGMIGPQTRSAVVAYQRKRRQTTTGRLDRWTLENLASAAFGG